MQEHWFLDLDGVRSGPYQTNEVLSLVADGEVLPHHLISTDLKSKDWVSILDWRLKQGKSAEKPVSSPTPQVAPTPTPPPKPAPTPTIESQLNSQPSSTKPEATTIEEKIDFEPPVKSGKADPMAEMFDVIQHTKHKREQKSQQEAAAQPILTPVEPRNDSTMKFVMICVVITALGFTLGQLFQKSSLPLNSSSTASSTPAPATAPNTPRPASPATAAIAPAPAAMPERPEVIDRSTEKMTIRSTIPNGRGDSIHSGKPEDLPQERRSGNGQDAQMIEDLKKELSELKALKEENRLVEDQRELPPDQPEKVDVNGLSSPTPGQPAENMNEPANPNAPNDPSGNDTHY